MTRETERRRRLTIYVPVNTPGRTIEQKARYIIAAGFAEFHIGETEPSPADRRKARAFRFANSQDLTSKDGYLELRVTIEGSSRAIAIYARVLKRLE